MSLIKPISNKEYIIRMIIIGLSFLTPILCVVMYGFLPSLSRYWTTDMQPLFILTNLFTAYYFFKLPNWKYSGVFLVLLTAFSVEHYNTIHNILAACFFLSILYSFSRVHHHRWFLLVYVGTLVILPFSMVIFEIVAVTVICLYHTIVLYKVNKLTKK